MNTSIRQGPLAANTVVCVIPTISVERADRYIHLRCCAMRLYSILTVIFVTLALGIHFLCGDSRPTITSLALNLL